MKKSFKFLAAAVAALSFAFGLASCEKQEELAIFNWTYYTPDTVIKKFEDEYNVKVIYESFASNEIMYAKIKAGGADWDIVFPSCDYVEIMKNQGMFAKLDHSKLQNLGNIDPEVLSRAVYDSDMEYSVPYYWGAAGVVVNKEKVPVFEKSWSIFANKELKGKMSMLDDYRDVMGDALKYLGFSVNSTDKGEIESAYKLIKDSWKPNLAKFDADAFGKSYSSGSFWVVQGYPEVVFMEIDDSKMLENSEFFIPREGGSAYIDSMCILKDAKNVDLAHKFIDFIHRPENYAEFCDYFRFPATVNVPARALLKKKPMYEASDLLNTELKMDIGEAVVIYNEYWDDIIR